MILFSRGRNTGKEKINENQGIPYKRRRWNQLVNVYTTQFSKVCDADTLLFILIFKESFLCVLRISVRLALFSYFNHKRHRNKYTLQH